MKLRLHLFGSFPRSFTLLPSHPQHRPPLFFFFSPSLLRAFLWREVALPVPLNSVAFRAAGFVVASFPPSGNALCSSGSRGGGGPLGGPPCRGGHLWASALRPKDGGDRRKGKPRNGRRKTKPGKRTRSKTASSARSHGITFLLFFFHFFFSTATGFPFQTVTETVGA